MSLDIKKLSLTEQNILYEISLLLNSIHIPTTYRNQHETHGTNHARRTGAIRQIKGRQMSLGLVYFQGKYKKSVWLLRYPKIYKLLRDFMRSHRPNFKFGTIGVNKNVRCKKHIDHKNAGISVIVGAGNYDGGSTVLYTPKRKEYNIKRNSLMFDGSKIEHASTAFTGTRYSLVYFSVKD